MFCQLPLSREQSQKSQLWKCGKLHLPKTTSPFPGIFNILPGLPSPKTSSSPLKIGLPKRKEFNQASIFRCKLCWLRFREGTPCNLVVPRSLESNRSPMGLRCHTIRRDGTNPYGEDLRHFFPRRVDHDESMGRTVELFLKTG